MSNTNAIALLPSTADKKTWNPQQTALMESLGLRGEKNVQRNGQWTKVPFEAPDSIIEAFIHQIHRTQLDPVARQIYCIERGGKWGVQISIDGFRLIAERSKEYRGQTPAQWTDGKIVQVPLREDGKIVRDAAGSPVMVEDYRWVDAWVSKEPPAAARVGVYRDGFAEPMWAVATYDGYVARDRNGNPTGQWETNPANQLAKCAEMLGLRKAFPQELSGLYGTEEMDQAGNPRGPAPAPARASQPPVVAEVVQPTRDWKAAIDAAESLAVLSDVARQAQMQGQLGVEVAPGVTVLDYGTRRREQLLAASRPEPVDVPVEAPQARDWVREARAKRTADAVEALWREAQALGASPEVLDQLLQIAASLPPSRKAAEQPPAEGWPAAVSEDEADAVEAELVEEQEGQAGVLADPEEEPF